MKKMVLLLPVLLMIFACNSNSQQRVPGKQLPPEEQADKMIEGMTEELQLTDQQQKELKTWFTASMKKRQENFQKGKEDRKKMHEAMQKERAETDTQLKKILTEEQYNKYKENAEKRRRERPRPGDTPREGEGRHYPKH